MSGFACRFCAFGHEKAGEFPEGSSVVARDRKVTSLQLPAGQQIANPISFVVNRQCIKRGQVPKGNRNADKRNQENCGRD